MIKLLYACETVKQLFVENDETFLEDIIMKLLWSE